MTDTTCEKISDKMRKRIKKFRLHRIAEIVADKFPAPVQLGCGTKAVLHFVPSVSLNPEHVIDVQSLAPDNAHFNFEGILCEWGSTCNTPPKAYLQVFRNGMVESVVTAEHEQNADKMISTFHLESYVLTLLGDCMAFAKKCDMDSPISVSLALVKAKGHGLHSTVEHVSTNAQKIDREVLLLGETTIESYDASPLEILCPWYDVMWQACGRLGMPHHEKSALEKSIRSHRLFQ